MKKLASKLTAVGLIMTMALAVAGCSGSAKAGSVVKTIDISLTDEQYAFGVNKKQDDLLEEANKFIAQANEDGTFDDICNNYFGDGTPQGVTSAKQDESKDQLVVVTNAEFAPFEYKEGETFYGIDMEMMAAFAEYLGQELVILDVDFEAVCTYVDTDKADIAAAGLTINETRKESVNFTDSYYTASQILIVPSSNTDFDDCVTAEDVMAKIAEQADGRIGGQSGTTAEYFVKGDADWDFAGIENMSWVGYTSGSLAVNDMLSGNINYVIIDEAPANMIVKKVNAAN